MDIRKRKDWLYPLAILAAVLAFRSIGWDYMLVPSSSMEPTLLPGDRIWVDKHFYALRLPWTLIGQEPQGFARGDIVTFEQKNTGQTWVKRVVGLPGDELEYKDGLLRINGTVCSNDGFSEKCPGRLGEHLAHGDPESTKPFEKLTVPDGVLFVMGDNRPGSQDSRFFGFLHQKQVTGKVLGIAFSMETGQWFKFRDRFGIKVR